MHQLLVVVMSQIIDLLNQGTRKFQEVISPSKQENVYEDDLGSEGSGSSWKMEDMNVVDYSGDEHLHEVSAVDSDDPMSLFKVLLDEYRHLMEYIPTGMVVAPSFHTLLEWHGSVHIREGFYKGGIFKFVINIPVDYPASAPAVYFFNAVFHPLVDPNTGRLDISIAFPTWKPGRDYLVLVLAFLKKIFFKRELNNYLVSMPRAMFEARCEECVSESLRLVYVCHPNSPIPFFPWRKSLSADLSKESVGKSTGPDTIETIVSNIPDDIPESEQQSKLHEWIFSEFIPMLDVNDSQSDQLTS
jgi:ubiquitin-protein ligase